MTTVTQFELTERFDKAFSFASALHRSQKRKNIPSPFMCHLMAVSSLVTENVGFVCHNPQEAEDCVITVMLHDTIEDQGGMETYDMLCAEFGQKIADNVMMLSDCTPKNGVKPPKSERNRIYAEKIRNAPAGIALISCCDKIHNMRAMVADSGVLGINEFWGAYSSSPKDTIDNYVLLGKLYEKKLPGQRIIKIYKQALEALQMLPPEEV
ncbi:MAG: bifunctional (p)ppGpp synthetase/guanosine-3',5'-bis(diphosphate) 3'-pyrophosphohydrolase [Proteobacteria bacterium]|nr:bifunctional (p)ppGpp synthetase/guanosine-3',5'-bis(diphosphate) 3'-pyrophosphohydrolase [Pseudomonadota bacterium]